jgi:hypothetical protein
LLKELVKGGHGFILVHLIAIVPGFPEIATYFKLPHGIEIAAMLIVLEFSAWGKNVEAVCAQAWQFVRR